MDPAARHRELTRALQAHAYRYYVLDDPTVSDAEYDKLYRQLVELEAEHPALVHPGSPTQRVGDQPRADLERYERPERMYSLDNVYNEVDIELWSHDVGAITDRDVQLAERINDVAHTRCARSY